MGLIVTILLGALVGYVAAQLLGRREGFLASLVIGVVGALLGSFVASLFNSGSGFLDLSVASLFWAFVGSVLVVWVLNHLQSGTTRTRL